MNITVEQMNLLVEKIDKLRREETEATKAKSLITEKLAHAESEMISALQTNELPNYRSPLGLVSLSVRASVKLPQEEQKQAFYAALREIGEYDLLISVNSQTLNSWYKSKVAEAIERGEEFTFPGLTEVKESTSLSFKRA